MGWLVVAPLAGQDSLPPLRTISLAARREVQVSWPLVDFVLTPNTIRGVSVYMAPSVRSAQGRGRTRASSTSRSIRRTSASGRRWWSRESASLGPIRDRPAPVPVAVALPAETGRAFFLLGKDPTPKARAPFLLIYHDSVSHAGWTAYASPDEVAQLLNALEDVASLSSYDSAATARADSVGRMHESREVQQVPRLISMHSLRFPSAEHSEGRVWVQYVVSAYGLVESQSIEVILSDGPGFSEAVRHALATAVYEPGRVNGVAIPVACFQVFTFRWRG